MKRIKKYWSILKETAKEFGADNVTKLSASLAYYTVFSLGPLMLVIVSLAGVFFETEAVKWKVYWQINELIGQNGADQIITIISKLQEKDASAFGLIGAVILLFGATTIFADMQDSINYIWSIKAKPKKGWLKFLKNRLLSFSLIVGLGFLLIVSLLVNTAADLLTRKILNGLDKSAVEIFNVINTGILFVIISFLFAVIYKVLPDAKIRWKDSFIGACFTGVLFLLGKFLIGYYLGSSNMDNTYGASASIVIILSWVYYTSIILYFGAEFTKVYALRCGGGIHPYDTAVFIIKKEAKEVEL